MAYKEKGKKQETGLEPLAGQRLIGLYLRALFLQLLWVDEYISMWHAQSWRQTSLSPQLAERQESVCEAVVGEWKGYTDLDWFFCVLCWCVCEEVCVCWGCIGLAVCGVCVCVCVQGQELTVRQMALLAFRDLVLLKLQLEDSLGTAASVPPPVTQMLLVLQVNTHTHIRTNLTGWLKSYSSLFFYRFDCCVHLLGQHCTEIWEDSNQETWDDQTGWRRLIQFIWRSN